MFNLDAIHQPWPWYFRYPLAIVFLLAALFLRFETLPEQSGLVYVTFYPAMILSFYLCGTGAGSLIAVLSGLLGYYYFVPPYASFAFDAKNCVSLGYYYLTALLIGYCITRLHILTEAQRHQRFKLERLQRIYATVLETDKLISKGLDESSLFNLVCRNAVEVGGMKMAWMGRVDASGDWIVPVASFGDGTAYLDGIRISTRAELPEGQGPTGKAFRQGKTMLNQDFMRNPISKPWHDRAQAYQWGSTATFPVRMDNQVYALLNTYSPVANAFDRETVSLMEGMAADIGHALDEFNLERARQQAEALLQEARQTAETTQHRLQHLLKHSPAVMYACRATGDFGATFISDNVSAQLGYQPQDFIADSAFWLEHIHPDDQSAVLEDLLAKLDSDYHSHEYRFRHKDGEYRRMRDELAVIRDSEGQALEMVGYWVDITERWEIEKALRLRQFSLDHADEEIYWVDENARLIDVNQSAIQKLGYSREELLTLSVSDIDPSFPMDQWRAHWQSLKKRGSLRIESMHLTKQGATYPTEVMANYFEYDGKAFNCAFVRDISDRKQNELAIQQESEKSAAFLRNASDGMHILDADGHVIEVSDSFCEMLGYERAEVMQMSVFQWDAGFASPEAISEKLTQLRTQTEPSHFESRHRRKDGSIFDVEISSKSLELGGKIVLFNSSRDITERKRLENELKRQVQTDFLTGVSSRGYFMEQAELELNRALRYDNPLSIFMMDIDFFKQINDTHGHRTGDLVLKKLAEMCRQTLREIDIIGRIGGEEFAVLLPETDPTEARNAAERLRTVLAKVSVPLLAGGLPLHFTVSIGVSSLDSGKEDNIDVLLNLADKALYEAKNSGRNRVCVTTRINEPS